MTDSPEVRAVFSGSVSTEGRLVFDEPVVTMARLLRIFKGHRVDVIVRREKKQRSDQANRYYWSMVVPVFSEATGYDSDEAHELLKAMFLSREVTLPDGLIVTKAGSSAALDTKEFAEYVDKCCRWLASQGWYVPSAHETVSVVQ